MAGKTPFVVFAPRDDSPAGFVDRSLSSHSSQFLVSSTNGAHAQPELKQSARSSSGGRRIAISVKRLCVLRCRSSDLCRSIGVALDAMVARVRPISGLGADGGHASRRSLSRMCCNDATVHCADVTRPCHQAALCSRPEVVTLVAIGRRQDTPSDVGSCQPTRTLLQRTLVGRGDDFCSGAQTLYSPGRWLFYMFGQAR